MRVEEGVAGFVVEGEVSVMIVESGGKRSEVVERVGRE